MERWIRIGFGQGEGDRFRPWMKIRDVPSLGRSTRIGALRHNRIHHLLSDVETGHFLQADYRNDVCELREHVALLPRDATIRIASELGVRHPTYPGTNVPVVMTSALWLGLQRPNQAAAVLCVKREQSLAPGAGGLGRTVEKLSIERRYWQDRGTPWYLVTQADFDSAAVKNLALLRPSRCAWTSAIAHEQAKVIAELVGHPDSALKPFRQVLLESGLTLQSAYEAFGLAIWKRWIHLNLRKPLRWGLPVSLLTQGDAHA